jgi:hypothetical protein
LGRVCNITGYFQKLILVCLGCPRQQFCLGNQGLFRINGSH